MYAERHRKNLLRPAKQHGLEGHPQLLTRRMRSLKCMSCTRAWKRARKEAKGEGSPNGLFGGGMGENHTPAIMARIKHRVNSAYFYAYVIMNIDTGLKMVYYKTAKRVALDKQLR